MALVDQGQLFYVLSHEDGEPDCEGYYVNTDPDNEQEPIYPLLTWMGLLGTVDDTSLCVWDAYLPANCTVETVEESLRYLASAVIILNPRPIPSEVWDCAVAMHESVLEHVPADMITVSMCYTAVKKNAAAMDFVPSHLKAPLLVYARALTKDVPLPITKLEPTPVASQPWDAAVEVEGGSASSAASCCSSRPPCPPCPHGDMSISLKAPVASSEDPILHIQCTAVTGQSNTMDVRLTGKAWRLVETHSETDTVYVAVLAEEVPGADADGSEPDEPEGEPPAALSST